MSTQEWNNWLGNHWSLHFFLNLYLTLEKQHSLRFLPLFGCSDVGSKHYNSEHKEQYQKRHLLVKIQELAKSPGVLKILQIWFVLPDSHCFFVIIV